MSSREQALAEIGRAALSADGYWAVNKVLVRKLGAETAFFLSYLISINENLTDHNGWFYRTEQARLKDTGIGHKTQRTIIKTLKDLHLILTKRVGTPARIHFKIDYEQILVYLHHKSHRASPAGWGELVRPDGDDKSGRMGRTSPAGRGQLYNKTKLTKTKKKEDRNQPCGSAMNMSQMLYGKLNPKAPQKIKKGAIAIQQILEDGYAPADVRAALKWILDQAPDPNSDFPGWAEVLRTRPGDYLSRKRPSKGNSTPFEIIFGMWEGRDTVRPKKRNSDPEALPDDYFDDYERKTRKVTVKRGRRAATKGV